MITLVGTNVKTVVEHEQRGATGVCLQGKRQGWSGGGGGGMDGRQKVLDETENSQVEIYRFLHN